MTVSDNFVTFHFFFDKLELQL